MEIDTDKLLQHAIADGLREGIKHQLGGMYNNSPLNKLIEASIAAHGESFRSMLDEALRSCIGDPKFREDIAASVRSVMAKTLVQRFGGEVEKRVNELKSDPATRARIILALDEIVKQK